MEKRLIWAGVLAAFAALAAVPVAELGPLMPWLKSLPCFLFAMACAWGPSEGRLWGASALGLAAVADFLLAQPSSFAPGIFAFLTVQTLFAWRFWSVSSRKPRLRDRARPFVILYGLILAVTMGVSWNGLGPMAIPFAVYGVTLVIMAIGAGSADEGPGLVVGGALFVLSDLIIVTREFVTIPQPVWDWVVLVPYYAAQTLLTLGLLKLQGQPQPDEESPLKT